MLREETAVPFGQAQFDHCGPVTFLSGAANLQEAFDSQISHNVFRLPASAEARARMHFKDARFVNVNIRLFPEHSDFILFLRLNASLKARAETQVASRMKYQTPGPDRYASGKFVSLTQQRDARVV